MDERLKGAGEKAKAARGKATTAAKERVEQIRAHEKSARSATEAARAKRREAASEKLIAIQGSVVQQEEGRTSIALHSVEADEATYEKSPSPPRKP